MTTKLLICISDFRQGGIPRCLQSLLTHIDTERVAVDVVCLSHEGPYSEQMPRCHVIAEDWQVAKWMVFTKEDHCWQSDTESACPVLESVPQINMADATSRRAYRTVAAYRAGITRL